MRTALSTVKRTGSLEATHPAPEGERSHNNDVFASERVCEPSSAEVSLPIQPGFVSAARQQIHSQSRTFLKGVPVLLNGLLSSALSPCDNLNHCNFPMEI